jgi:hypothetical protein
MKMNAWVDLLLDTLGSALIGLDNKSGVEMAKVKRKMQGKMEEGWLPKQ